MRAFTTFNVKLYPILPAEGADEAVERVHELHFQEDGIKNFSEILQHSLGEDITPPQNRCKRQRSRETCA
jgi:hypothetical protein